MLFTNTYMDCHSSQRLICASHLACNLHKPFMNASLTGFLLTQRGFLEIILTEKTHKEVYYARGQKKTE
jgi:hypothetical protein